MENKIFIFAFGTFGNPHGFKQTSFFGNKEIARHLNTFDLNTNAIKLFPGSIIYSLRKEILNGSGVISYSKYSYAQERNSDRSGTFIGNSISFIDQIAEENIIIDQLDDVHQQLTNKYVIDNRLTVSHSSEFAIHSNEDFEKINYHLRDITNVDFKAIEHKSLLIYTKIGVHDLVRIMKDSLELLAYYDSIYFTDNAEVVKYVYQKGMYRIIQNTNTSDELNTVLNECREYSKLKFEKSVSEFEAYIQNVINEKNKILNEYHQIIDEKEKKHKENEKILEASKQDLGELEQYYSDLIKKNNELINQYKNKSIDLYKLKTLINNNKQIFINQNKGLRNINLNFEKFSHPKQNIYSYPSHSKDTSNDRMTKEHNYRKKKKSKFSYLLSREFQIIFSLILLLIIILILLFKL